MKFRESAKDSIAKLLECSRERVGFGWMERFSEIALPTGHRLDMCRVRAFLGVAKDPQASLWLHRLLHCTKSRSDTRIH